MSNLPLPFCHAVYQERLRKDVKKISAVATVPFLSLISFQRCLSSAECRGPRSCHCLPPSVSLSLSLASGCGDGRRHGHRVLQPVKTLRLTGRVNTDFSARKQGRCCSPVGASSLFVVRGTKKNIRANLAYRLSVGCFVCETI